MLFRSAGLEGAAVPDAAASTHADDESETREPPVPLRNRALPLLKLLEAAARRDSHVMWEQA